MRALRALAAVAVLVAAVGLAPSSAGPAAAAATDSSSTITQRVTRDIRGTDGTIVATDARTVSLSVSATKDIRAQQVVSVSWSGAHPSSNYVGDVNSADAWSETEYPMIVLQCRGTGATVTPQTCWTTLDFKTQRKVVGTDGGLYQDDYYSSADDRAASIPSADEWPTICTDDPLAGTADWPKRIVPFVAANGTMYWGCGSSGVGSSPPEEGYATPMGPNEKAAFTTVDGTGSVNVQLRTAAENASLGCSATVSCVLVAIPIMGLTCRDGNVACNKEGVQPAGSRYNSSNDYARAVTGQFWFSASNWNNRMVVPLTFAATSTACGSVSGRTTLQLYGSPLISEAADQWAPAYCANADRFVLQFNDQVEPVAYRNLLNSSIGDGVVSSYPMSGSSTFAYAPVAVTGFAIAFVLDDPVTGLQLHSLNLNARLLAKLMTGSYWGYNPPSTDLAARPDLAKNPLSLQLDPEFQALNPSLSSLVLPKDSSWWSVKFTMSQLMSLSAPADVMTALTTYLADDADAAAFLSGVADPWGMTVNSYYKDYFSSSPLPSSSWPLADTWNRYASATQCESIIPVPWFNRVLSPVSDLHKIAQDMVQGKSEGTPNYTQDVISGTCVPTTTTLPSGSRALLGLVSLADARRFALPTASLRTSGAHFVAPTDDALNSAAATATSLGTGQAFTVDESAVLASGDAYPGTMILHAAFPLSGMSAVKSATAASFVKIATTEGQVSGGAAGQLADGYLPLSSSGSTAALYQAAQTVATGVANQIGSFTPTATSTTTGTTTTTSGTATVTGTSSAQMLSTQAVAPAQVTTTGLPAPTASATAAASTTPTPRTTIGLVKVAIPVGLGAALAAGLAVPFLRRTPRGTL